MTSINFRLCKRYVKKEMKIKVGWPGWSSLVRRRAPDRSWSGGMVPPVRAGPAAPAGPAGPASSYFSFLSLRFVQRTHF